MSRILLSLFYTLVISLSFIEGAINSFSFVGTNPQNPPTSSLQKIGSSIELKLVLDAGEGLYTLRAFRNSNLNQVISEKKDIIHSGGIQNLILNVPLDEGVNDYFLRIVETSAAGGQATTSTASFPVVRDLENDVTGVRLNHIETEDDQISLHTSLPTVKLFYSLHGNASKMRATFFRNGQQVGSADKDGAGHYSQTAVPLELNTLNLFQVRASSLDPSAPATGFQAESNILRIHHDDQSPKILGITTTFQSTPPPPGTKFGPTNLASFGLIVESDTPFARISILNTQTGNEVTRFAQNDGRLIIAGIELPRDPSLGPFGITTTTYAINVMDQAGNLTPVTTEVERLTLRPCFNLLQMEPGDFGFLREGEALSIIGAVCDDEIPHRIEFSIASQYSDNSFRIEEQLRGLLGGETFNKDISIPSDTFQPFSNQPVSVQAVIFTTNPGDANLEEASPAHDLGVIILDLKPPAPPVILTEQVLFAMNSPTLTIDGTVERGASVDVNAVDSFILRPAKRIPAVGSDFRSVVDLGFVAEGEYAIHLTAMDQAGNTGIGSQSRVILKYDKRAPAVKDIRINQSKVERDRPLFVRSGDTVQVRILVDEKLIIPPRCYITQQGSFGVELGLTEVINEGLEFEYQYVVLPSSDGSLDGAAEVVVVGGRDSAGNHISPEFREPKAFYVDSLPPVLMRNFVTPADGSVVKTAPTPLRLVMQEHPKTKDLGSGPNPFASSIKAFGPLESTPSRSINGRVEVFDPRTFDFYPSASEMIENGTYLFEVRMLDHAGNSFLETIVLQLDTEIPSSNLILNRFPEPGAFFNALSLPQKNGLPFFSLAVEPSLTPELVLSSTRSVALNLLNKPQKYKLSNPAVISSSSVEFSFLEKFNTSGGDDGVIVIQTEIQDLAGNFSDVDTFSYIYDTLPPKVMDGLNFPVPEDFSLEDLRSPAHGSIVNGPLRIISAPVYEPQAPNTFFGSGIRTEVLSNSSTPTTTISLELIQPLGSQSPGVITSGKIKFKGDLTQDAPFYGGPSISRVLYELGVNPSSLEPSGLPTDGSFDGLYKMEVIPVDESLNIGQTSTSLFLYDTIKPLVSVEILNESWITSSVVRLSGKAFDPTTRDDFLPGFGSTKGLGVRTVQIQIESVNNVGSATFPPLLEFTNLVLDRDPDSYPSNHVFGFRFEKRFHDFNGPVRIKVRAYDHAGNAGYAIKDIGLETNALSFPLPLEPLEGYYSQGGILKFSWRPVEKANAYRLEILDSENNWHSRELPFGTIETNLNLDFLPSGKTLWKVDALDGVGNSSQSQERRSFVIDRLKPQVRDVTFSRPVISPDQEGRILESQVRVHMRFSEELDVKNPPSVFFRPGPKQLRNSLGQSIIETFEPIKLNLVHLNKDQYTGMIRVLPLEEDNDFNGLGQIEVRAFQDLAGNHGDLFTHEFELDLGPYFEFKIFSNPIRDSELIFVAKGLDSKGGFIEEIAEIPFMQVRQLKDPGQISTDDQLTSVQLNRLGPSFFHGTFPLNLDLSGFLRIEITGGDIQGNRMTRVIPFQVQRLSSSRSKVQASKSLALFPYHTKEIIPDGFMPVFNALPARTLDKSVDFSVKIQDYPLDPKKNYGLIGLDSNGARSIVKQRKTTTNILFHTAEPSSVVLMEDMVPPVVSVYPEGEDLSELTHDLSGEVSDLGVGLDCDGIQINSSVKKLNWICEDLHWKVPLEELPAQKTTIISIDAVDYAGNQSRKNLSVTAAGPLRIKEAVVFPNPVRNRARVHVKTSIAAGEITLSIYDSASNLLTTQTFLSESVQFEQDILALLPSEPANGVYFLRIRARDRRGFSDSKTVKFVSLR